MTTISIQIAFDHFDVRNVDDDDDDDDVIDFAVRRSRFYIHTQYNNMSIVKTLYVYNYIYYL